MTIFLTFSPTSNHFHPLQVENCGINSRFVEDEDDTGKFRVQRVKYYGMSVSEGLSKMKVSFSGITQSMLKRFCGYYHRVTWNFLRFESVFEMLDL